MKDRIIIPGISSSSSALTYLMGYAAMISYVTYVFWPVFEYPWWGADDPMILYKFQKHGLLNMLISGDSWRDLTSFNFNPWLVVTLGMDLKAFGLNPTGFYCHQWLTVLALAVAIEVALRQVDRHGLRFFFIIIFLALYPVKYTLVHIFMRHYLEGLLFSILSILLWRKGRPFFSAFFYFLAVCSKETYALLPIVFWAVHGFSRKSLLCLTVPAMLYVAWRAVMLGVLGGIGGYGCLVPPPNIGDIIRLPTMMAKMSGVQEGLFLALLVMGIVVVTQKMGIVRLVSVVVALVLPILPVLRIAQGNSRYLFLLYGFWALCTLFTWLWMMERRPVSRWSWAGRLAALGLCVAFVFLGKGLSAERFKRRMVEGRFVWERIFPQGERHYLVGYLMTPWHFEALVRLRGHDDGPMYCHDATYCVAQFKGAHFWQWKGGGIRPISPLATTLPPCNVPFEIRYDTSSQTFSWDAGACGKGRFYLILNMEGIGLAEYQLPPSCSIGYVFSPPYPEIGIKLARQGSVCYSSLVRPNIYGNEVTWSSQGLENVVGGQ